MNEREVQVWGIHGGHTGDADAPILKRTDTELDVLLPSILARAFKGEL
jgi:hypothetical protein